MTPQELLPTAILLGAFVLCAGCYGLLYAVGRLRTSHTITMLAYAAYVLQGLVTAVVLTQTPLAPGWKLLLVASFLAYAVIPPITWRHLERTHQSMEHES